MFINNFDPVAFNFFSLEIRWYSLAYIFGITIGWFYCKKYLIKDRSILNIFDDLIAYLIIGIILGGRLGYILIYNFDYYLNHLTEILMIWKGGMSFHGGLVGVLISTLFFSKKHNINPFIFLDLISAVAPIGIFLGRIANFLNSELYGKETEIFWSVIFPKIDNLTRHPSQIYEALFEGLILFLILNLLIRKNMLNKKGEITSYFLIFYSLFRFLLEFFREPDPQIGYLIIGMTMGQILCVFLFVIGIGLFFKKNEN